jgi:hypothetical protein
VLKCRIASGLISPANQIHISAIPSHTEGRLAIVTNAGRDAVDALAATDERKLKRTAKSCGPDASTPASSSWEASFSGATVTRKPDRRGEHEVSRKTTAQGRPECFR